MQTDTITSTRIDDHLCRWVCFALGIVAESPERSEDLQRIARPSVHLTDGNALNLSNIYTVDAVPFYNRSFIHYDSAP